MDQPHLFDFHTASSVAQVNQGREQDLDRGPCGLNMLQSPLRKISSKYVRLLQCNINGLSIEATRIRLDQILEIADKLHVEILALQETKLCKQRLLNAKGYNIVRKDRASGGCGLMFLIREVCFQRLPDIGNGTSDLEFLETGKQIDNLKPCNEENNAIISDNSHVSVDDREVAEVLAHHYANESRLPFNSYDKKLARIARNQIKSCKDRPADKPLFNVLFT
ncbi:RNA-directed DNA polymerase from mobile element jockey [Trichonephila clavata]|uniref:RNA-directed DNA polymerase from mobile element jockey n=1 Tax=Trichonephila clavata TaxID=2740835 RepID=A0A8X6IP72_TRICU|nr:RNA-directed DNA polymerase from mobile element jockey [Trichonephila clavata]